MKSLLIILGDIHGFSRPVLELAVARAKEHKAAAIIQVGDFGWWPNERPHWNLLKPEIPIYWIDGNHEYFPEVPKGDQVVEVAQNIFFVPRGSILELGGHKIAFLGGAGSIDYKYRNAGKDWFPDDECPKMEEAERFKGKGPVDLLVSHMPPASLIKFRLSSPFDLMGKLGSGVGQDWWDPSGDVVESAVHMLGLPPVVCGHWHRSLYDRDLQMRILNTNEMILYEGSVWPRY